MNFAKFLRIPFLQNTFGLLLLKFISFSFNCRSEIWWRSATPHSFFYFKIFIQNPYMQIIPSHKMVSTWTLKLNIKKEIWQRQYIWFDTIHAVLHNFLVFTRISVFLKIAFSRKTYSSLQFMLSKFLNKTESQTS